ncbi:MAG: cytochrome P460 family protein [Mitsuaria chitosanitabida]|uniref:cytochrome P460 family protein n=1 Tax=Roseateles chitosanitabidus TaxID=65048 RepID=UPI001B1A5182|nr:cytochrome P460 family protein [Roseateles chitosanitabidus]MBO9686841.1 cytochrome P460 family protein [Roseateles chitosanitabidus]
MNAFRIASLLVPAMLAATALSASADDRPAKPAAPATPVPKAAKAPDKPASPIYGVTLPDGYRQWQMIGVATEDAPLDELRAVVGNSIAVEAYRLGKLPFPDGAMLVKLAWKRERSKEFPAATVPGHPTTVQVMVKDAKRYAQSGGWGYGRFINGQPVDAAQHQTCFACHESLVKDRDDVFTRFAP